jgi:membrane protein DedA with SNARE-associated domain
VRSIGLIVQNMNDSSVETNSTVGRPPHGGPPLSLLAAISLVLLLAGLVIGVALAGVMPLPYGSATAIQDYVAGHHAAAVAIAVGTFGSSIPLAIYAATASARLRQLGITAPGATIALRAASSRRPASRCRA